MSTARAVIGRRGLLVWPAFSVRSLMPVEIVDSGYSIKEVEERLICRFLTNNKQLLHFANTPIARQSSQNRSYLTASLPVRMCAAHRHLISQLECNNVNRFTVGSSITAGSGLIAYDTSIWCCGGVKHGVSLTLTHLGAWNCFAPPHGGLKMGLPAGQNEQLPMGISWDPKSSRLCVFMFWNMHL